MDVMRFLGALVILLSVSTQLFSQATIRGRITDANGEALIGVSVYLKANPAIGTAADMDGLYSLRVEETGEHTLVIQYVSYETIYDTIEVVPGETIVKDY